MTWSIIARDSQGHFGVTFAAFMKAERERWAGIVKAIGIKAE
jgi:hypothetical protein